MAIHIFVDLLMSTQSLLFAFQSGSSKSSTPASRLLNSRIGSTGLFHKSWISWAIEDMLNIVWCLAADVEASILTDSALVGAEESTMSKS